MIRPTTLLSASVALAATLVLAACGGGGSGDDDDDGNPRPRIPTTRGAWTSEFAVGDGAGRQAQAVWVPDDFTLGVAYFASAPMESGEPCAEEPNDDIPPEATRRFYRLEYASERPTWRKETVADILHTTVPFGLDMTLDPATGQPVVVSIAGERALQVCIASDVGLFRRAGGGSWTGPQIAVATSGQATVTGGTAAASNFGDVVGWWPALAFGPDGRPFVAYSDRHAGGIQNDDARRADLEVAWGQGAGWDHQPVDAGEGAGDFIRVAFDADGAPLIAYQNPQNFSGVMNRQGLHVARYTGTGPRTCAMGGRTCLCEEGWDCVRLRTGPNQQKLDMAVGPDGTIHVVAYDPADGIAELWSLAEDGTFADAATWTQETAIGDPRFDEGREPSIAIDAAGRIGIAYFRCRIATDTTATCPFSDDALVFTWRGDDGEWTTEVIDDGPEVGECGRNPSLVFEENAGETTAHIAYLCQNLDAQGRLVDELWVAKREPF